MSEPMTDEQLAAFYASVVTEPDGSTWVSTEVLNVCTKEIRKLRKVVEAALISEETGDLLPLSEALSELDKGNS